jgi:1-acyl-sn-glycerol-3-phosphate acyltransferase
MLVFWINPFWRIHIQGRHHIQWHKPYVIVSNHQSNFDIILFGLFRHFKWLSKESLKKIPTVGWNMVMNRYIFIDRKNPQSRRKGLKQCRDWLKRGISVLIFPEGTRSKTGDLGDFQLGAFRMALKENVPLLPVVINGTQGILKKHSFYLSAGRKDIFVKVLEPVPSDKFQADQAMEFQIAVKKKMASALEELR